MSRPASISEETPLLRTSSNVSNPNSNPDSESNKKKTGRRPSIIALTILCVGVVILLASGFAAPAVVEEYAKEAVVFNPEKLSIESFTSVGVRARVRGTFYLDASKVEKKSVRDLGRFATWLVRKVETDVANVNVYLPKYDNVLLGKAKVPSITFDIRNAHRNHLDFVVDLEPGEITGIRTVAQDLINGQLKSMDVTAEVKVAVKSGLISLGTQTILQDLHFKKGHTKIPKFDIQKLKVVEYGIPGHPEGLLAKARVSAINSYPLSFDVPPVAMDVFLPDCSGEFVSLGTAKTDVVHILPEQKVFADVKGLVNQLPASLTTKCDQSDKSPLDAFIGAYLAGKPSKIYVKGGEQDPVNTPEWMAKLLQDTMVPVPVPAGPLNDLIKRFSLTDVHLTLPEDELTPPKMSATVHVVVGMPENIDLRVDVDRVRADADVYYKGKKMGELDLRKWQHANSSKHDDELWVQSEVVDAPVKITDEHVFSDVVQEMIFGKGGVELTVQAQVDVDSATALGKFVVRSIPAAGKIQLAPLDGGEGGDGIQYAINDMEVFDSTPETLILKTGVSLVNPTGYSASIPFTNMSIWCNETKLGDAWGSFDFKPGDNNLTAYASFGRSEVGREFLSQYLSGRNVSINIRSHEGSIPGLPSPNISAIFPVPHLFGKFLRETTMHIFSSSATFMLFTPISLYVTTIASSAFYNGTEIGTIDYDFPFKVITGGTTTPKLPVVWNNNGGFGLIREALGGTLKLDARAEVGVKIGDWTETVWYEAKGLGAKIRL